MTPPCCIDCDEPVNPHDPNTLHEVVGFHRDRSAGGQNHVRFRAETGRLLCVSCANRRQYGIGTQQAAMPL